MIKYCKICGQEFEAANPNQKYCSEACQREALKRNRAAWIERTGWKAKDAERHRLKRDARREILRQEHEKHKEINQQEAEARAKQKQADLDDRAAAGDPNAQMIKALQSGGKFNAEYWKAYAAAQVEYADGTGRPCSATVNGISVLLPDFAEQVVKSITAGAAIICRQK